jgi:hypothetical protein
MHAMFITTALTPPLPLFSRLLTGKVVDDKKVFRKFVNVQEENNNLQK